MRSAIAIFLVMTFFVSSCAKIQEPEFREIKEFEVISVGLEGVTIEFGLSYFNPNNFTVTVKETVASVYIDSVFLGEFRQDTSVVVNENAEFTIPLSGTIPLAGFSKMNLQDIHKREVLIQAEGSTRVGKAGIFIRKNISYSGRHRLSRLRL